MDNEVHIVDQYPLGLTVPLDVRGTQPRSLKAQFHLVCYRLHLPRIRTAAQHEVVGECRPLLHFKYGKFFSFLVKAGLNGCRYLELQIIFLHARWFVILIIVNGKMPDRRSHCCGNRYW